MGAFDAYVRLEGLLSGRIVCDEPLARHTTYRIGGPADLYAECETLADLSLLIEVLAEEEVPWTVIGRGSNLLVADEGYRGAAIVLGREFARLDFHGFDQRPEGEPLPASVLVTAGAALPLSRLVQTAFGLGLAGLEFAVGTPGTVGGAARMNAGTASSWFGSVVDSVTVFIPGQGLCIFAAEEIEWGYRSSSLPADGIIVELVVRLAPSDKMMLHAAMEAGLKRRRASQPLSLPSCGSVFKGAGGTSAGELIESCGLKGCSCGGAEISPVHANFIVNNGSATAQDVLSLMKLARDKVREKHGVELQPEVRFLGFSD